MKKIINQRLLFSLLLIAIFIIFLLYPLNASAEGLIQIKMPEALEGTPFTSVPTAISAIFSVVVGSAGAIFVVIFLIGGIQYLVSAGNEEATTKAKKLLVDAIIGLVIVLASWAIGTWILSSLRNDNSNNNVNIPATTVPSSTTPSENTPNTTPNPTETTPTQTQEPLPPPPATT